MILYTVIMIPVAILLTVMAVLIHRGKTELIHDYHRQRVTDKTAYGKAFGKAMGVIPVGMLLSGILALFGESLMWTAMAVLFGGIVVGVVGMILVQKKYNGGVFS